MIEVEELFSRDDDVRDIQDIKKMTREIDLYCNSNLKDAKELIKRKSILNVFIFFSFLSVLIEIQI